MDRLSSKTALGNTGLTLPPVIFGTSCLGNLYQALPWETKLQIMQECFLQVAPPVVFDSAGKYGAGLALEIIGRGLRELDIAPEEVVISNKLGWLRTPLRTTEPTFEPGAWIDLEHDAVQSIGYGGILACWEQGCELLGDEYRPDLASVHDPDEYLSHASCDQERAARLADVVDAYRALAELKAQGVVRAVGVGSKDWRVIRELAQTVALDWVMFACSLTIMHHPPELLAFVDELAEQGTGIVNSAVFHAGFLTGGAFFDYRKVDPDDARDRPLFEWRKRFRQLCGQFAVEPAQACVRFGLSAPGVVSVALNTSKPSRIRDNIAAVQAEIPRDFWHAMKREGLISEAYPHVG